MKRKKVLAITGIRSEYDILYPVIRRLRDDKHFDVKVVVCGAHLSDWHGLTYKKIIEDGFEIVEKIDYLLMTNEKTQRAKGIGILTYALTQTVDRENSDFLLVVGDREESLATAIVGNYLDKLVAHIGGGDPVFGNADDPIRFATSKLAHIHFTTAEVYAENLKGIGEDAFRTFFVGNPAYENIQGVTRLNLEQISDRLNFDIKDQRYLVLLKHPLSSQKEKSFQQMKTTLEAVDEFAQKNQLKVIGIYPNTDPGAVDILNVINRFEQCSHMRFFKTLPRDVFVNMMRHALVLVGNSSMGILEAPFYKLPVVNVGLRQQGRLNAGNVEFVDYHKNHIQAAIRKACFDQEYRKKVARLRNPFSNGVSSERIRKVLESIDLEDKKWYVKKSLC